MKKKTRLCYLLFYFLLCSTSIVYGHILSELESEKFRIPIRHTLNTPTLAVTPTDPTACGANDGELAFTFTNVPDGTYTISYKNLSDASQTLTGVVVSNNTAVVTGLSPDRYRNLQITVSGCTSPGGVTESLFDPGDRISGLFLLLTPNVICQGDKADISIRVSRGVGPYTVVYNNGTNDITLTGYTSGTILSSIPTTTQNFRLISITDANGCSASNFNGAPNLTIFPVPTITVNSTNPTTCGGSDGQLDFTFTDVRNANHTITYKDENGTLQTLNVNVASNTATVTGLSAGTFTDLQITVDGCTSAIGISETLSDPSGSTTSVLSGTTSICSGSSANLAVSITGGMGLYTVVYNDGTSNITETGYTSGNTITVNPIATTTYSLVSVTDAKGCPGSGLSGTPTVTILEPTMTASSTNPTTCGGSDGQLDFTFTDVRDGSHTINYKDENGTLQTLNVNVASNTATVAGLSAGTFTDLQITVDGCPSAIGLSETLSDLNSCSFSFFADNIFMAEDPCSCNGDQVLNLDGTVATPGTFAEVVTVTGPPGLFLRVRTITDAAGNPFILTDNRLPETSPGSGTYEISLMHTDRLGYLITAFEYSAVEAGPYSLATGGVPAFTPITISNVCAYPRIVCSPLASILNTTDTPINLNLTELSTDISFTGTATFTINGTAATVFDPANPPAIVGTNSIAASYDIIAGSGMLGTLLMPAVPIDINNDPSDGVCPVSLPSAKLVEVTIANNIPTLSQWGLIIIGLILLNLGVFFIKREELFLKIEKE